jgi:hypothetical protein
MNPHFFFLGKLSREESTSAFLATLLEQHADFRSYFFKTAEIEEPHGVCHVSVEEKEVDIRIDYPDAKVVVLIENKVRPGALKVSQLVRYYHEELLCRPECRILSVLVAPGDGVGINETRRLERDPKFRPSDAVYRVSWQELTAYRGLSKQEDRFVKFVEGGFDSITKIIETAAEEKYPLVGGRDVAHDIVQSAYHQIRQNFTAVNFQIWRSKDSFTIFSLGTDFTVYIDLVFRIDEETNIPLEMSDKQHINAIIRTQFTLSGKGKRNSDLKRYWDRLCSQGKHDIPNCGKHILRGRWFKYEEPVRDNADSAAQKLAILGGAVILDIVVKSQKV